MIQPRLDFTNEVEFITTNSLIFIKNIPFIT